VTETWAVVEMAAGEAAEEEVEAATVAAVAKEVAGQWRAGGGRGGGRGDPINFAIAHHSFAFAATKALHRSRS
jgi:hypothetical protein